MLGFKWLIARRYFALGQKRPLLKLLSWPFVLAVLRLIVYGVVKLTQHLHNVRLQDLAANNGTALKLTGLIVVIVCFIVFFFVVLLWRLTIFTTISVFGLFLGTAALVIVLSVMSGFEQDLKHKILGTNAHIVVTRLEQPFSDYTRLRNQMARLPDVIGATPFIMNEVMLTSSSNESGVVVKGIDTATVGQVTDIAKNTDLGDLGYLDHPEKLRSLGGPSLFHDDDEETAKSKAKDDAQNAAKPTLKDAAEPKLKDDDKLFLPKAGREGSHGAKDAPAARKSSPAEAAAKGGVADLPTDSGAEHDKDAAPPGAVHFAPADAHGHVEAPAEPPVPDRRIVPGVIVGRELAKSLRIYLGDDVNLISPFGGIGPTGAIPKSKPFRVAGIFFSGMFEYDNKYTYVSLAAAQKFFTMDGEVTGIELKVSDPDRSEVVVARIKQLVGPGYDVQDWKELNRSLFSALKIEKILMFVLLCFIILVAAFSIIANGTMLVMEKGREVAILKSMGASDRSILGAFMLLGLFIGGIGTVSGIVVGVFSCWALGHWGLPLDPDVYYITSLPVQMNPYEIATVFFAALAIALLATLYPAWMAARLRPVDGLREV
jgi:lipoprotein-releasing system permease protein